MKPWVLELLKDVVVPIVTSFFHEYFEKHGRLPNVTEVKQLMDDQEVAMSMQGLDQL